jgi:diguanylate cyclase (GGDEF)-like protein
LSKVESFSLIDSHKTERSFRLKVVRGEADKEKIIFRLVLQDALDMRKDDALRKALQDNFKGHEVLDPALGVPDRKSLEKDIELAGYYNRKTELRASFVMIKPDHLDAIEKQYGAGQRAGFLKHIANICRRSLRPDDVVGAVDDKKLGVVLLDSQSDATRMVANRLRWQIAANPYILPDKTAITFSASMVYTNIDGAVSPAKIVDGCDQEISALADDAASQLKQADIK